MEGAKSQVHRIGDLVAQLLRAQVRPRRKELGELSDAWARAAGPETARRSRPVGFKDGRLTVHVDSAALRQEIVSFRKEEILAKLREAYPAARVASLKCVLGERR
jgi:predicted nucleic acid-binding Zn ribbon protein